MSEMPDPAEGVSDAERLASPDALQVMFLDMVQTEERHFGSDPCPVEPGLCHICIFLSFRKMRP